MAILPETFMDDMTGHLCFLENNLGRELGDWEVGRDTGGAKLAMS